VPSDVGMQHDVGTISRSWLDRLEKASPSAYDEVVRRLGRDIQAPPGLSAAEFERLIPVLRPSIAIKNDLVDLAAGQTTAFSDQLATAQHHLRWVTPSVGRIETTNLPINGGSIGTGWLIAEDTIVTNRHLVDLIGVRDGEDYQFRSDPFGEPIKVLFQIKSEIDQPTVQPYQVTQILWAEPNRKADIAFLKVNRPINQTALRPIALATEDPAPGTLVATVGHPFRDSPAFPTLTAIGVDKPNVKRLAPGFVLSDERGWATHDCNSLGGDPGAAIVDLATGKAVGLQFVTSEPLKNFFIKASTISDCLRRYSSGREMTSAGSATHAGENNKIDKEISVPIRLRLSVQVDQEKEAREDRLPPPAPLRPLQTHLAPVVTTDIGDPPIIDLTDDHDSVSDGGGRVAILYATTRKPDVTETGYFTGERNKAITYGSARIRIPQKHRIGRVELPFRLALFSLTFYQQALDPRKHFIIEGIDILSLHEWKKLISTSSLGHALVFVHGFNVTFRDALYRLAQVTYDIQYTGLPVLFSWPSRGQMLDYGYDRESALVAHDALISVLKTLRSAGINRIHILAHSMGNFLVLEALGKSIRGLRGLSIGEMMMAAPDLDKDHYLAIAPKISGSFGMTLYASAADRALLVAKKIAGNIPRAGDVPEGGPVLVDGIDSIDATAVGTEILGLGHSVFATQRSILNDIGLVIQGMRPPHERLSEIRGVPGRLAPKWWRYVF
jgi:esterase/lipase superfamily enzyme